MINLLKIAFPSFYDLHPVENGCPQRKASSLFDRLGDEDSSSFAECIATNSGFVLDIATTYTADLEDAGSATAEIFNEIWEYGASSRFIDMDEHKTISYIAHQYFLNRSRGLRSPKLSRSIKVDKSRGKSY